MTINPQKTVDLIIFRWKTSFCVQLDISALFSPDSDTKGYYFTFDFVVNRYYYEKIYKQTNRRKYHIKNSKSLPHKFYRIFIANVVNVQKASKHILSKRNKIPRMEKISIQCRIYISGLYGLIA